MTDQEYTEKIKAQIEADGYELTSQIGLGDEAAFKAINPKVSSMLISCLNSTPVIRKKKDDKKV